MIRNKFLILFFMVLIFPVLLNAQGNNGRGKCMQPFGISYYLVEGGDEDEWLELYMKWHYPLMQYALDHGSIIEHKLFVPDGHGIEAQWTFAVSFLFPNSQESKPAPLGRAELITKLYGNQMDDYIAGEQRRWELTTKHWDTDFIELDKSEIPLSVYRPSLGGCEKKN
ncbi:uncharacterized protein METZ01_LOCUS87941 [marine metagenome]|uniref:Uncharacterized protein n=1 Tax=marine metagenome TaxID=408172 RepID=A0A381V5Y7_9ZZZZ|tara:strand:- start:860 stop:1363 length:504 start_codon:yes stop_codon:yes gene_type:complete